MRVAIEKIEGVTSVSVSLNEGMTTIQFAASNSVRIEQIREVIRKNGFTPKEAEIKVAGLLNVRGDTLALASPGVDEPLLLQDFPGTSQPISALRQLSPNATITVAGQVPASEGRSAKPSQVLFVRSFVAGLAGANQ